MELLGKKLKLTNLELRHIKETALVNYKELAPSPGMDSGAFLSYCWVKAALDILETKDVIEFELIK